MARKHGSQSHGFAVRSNLAQDFPLFHEYLPDSQQKYCSECNRFREGSTLWNSCVQNMQPLHHLCTDTDLLILVLCKYFPVLFQFLLKLSLLRLNPSPTNPKHFLPRTVTLPLPEFPFSFGYMELDTSYDSFY